MAANTIPIPDLDDDNNMTSYEINYNNNMMRSFLVNSSVHPSNTTLQNEGMPFVPEEREYTHSINPNNYVIDYKKLENLKLIRNIGASNIFNTESSLNFVY